MIFLLQLILCFYASFSTICFGMEDQENKIISNITHVSKSFSNPYFDTNKLISGKLQLYYKVYESKDDLHCSAYCDDTTYKQQRDTCISAAARFIPTGARSIIKFNNASWDTAIVFLRKDSNLTDLVTYPLYMLCKIKGKDAAYVLEVKECEKSNESEELLDLPRFKPWVNGDNISLYNAEKRIVLYDQKNIRQIRQALSHKKQFMIEFHDQVHGNSISKVTSYGNGAYIWWDGWNPSLKLLCAGMTFDLNIGVPFTIPIDLNKEKEELHHYSRNKFIRRAVTVAILAALCYNKLNC